MIKIVSVNIERSNHLEKVLAFLDKEKPDVICLQEVCEIDLPLFSKYFGGRAPVFSAVTKETEITGRAVVHGTAIGGVIPYTRQKIYHYAGDDRVIPETDESNQQTSVLGNREVVMADFEKGGEKYCIASTHFTWSSRGASTDQQKQDMKKMLDVLSAEQDLVLTGDFNAPRGGETFSMLTDKYKDNVPEIHKTSLDASLHRAGREGRGNEISDKMVDGIFSTPGYRIADVDLVFGVSDHAAIVASVWKA